jgi:ligand-binding sensor domain-containing protein/serine phosphatase RsbU (regulator of sigma subunit)
MLFFTAFQKQISKFQTLFKLMKFFLLIILLHISLVSLAQKSLRSLDPHKKLTQYILDQWTTDDGLPSNNVRKLYQTRNGYLWLSGFDGLVNFDGVRFNSFNRRNIPELLTNSIYALAESANQTFWLGTEGSGLFSYKNGVFKKVGFGNDFITNIFIEDEKRYWVGVRQNGLFIYSPEKNISQPVDYQALTKTSVYTIRKDKAGAIWFCTDGKGLTRLQKNQFKTFTQRDSLPSDNVLELFFDRQGQAWIGTTKGLAKFDGKKITPIPELKGNIVYRVVEDDSGSLWIASSVGLYRRNVLNGKFELFPFDEQTPLTNVIDLLLDAEGSLWIATYRNGLFRLKDGKFTNFTYQDGLSTASVGSICELDKGKYLLGMNNGVINLIDKNQISVFKIKTPLPKVRVFNIFKDSEANLWISTFNGVLKIDKNGQETFLTKEQGLPDNAVRVTFQDSKGNIWLGTRAGGVAKWDKNQQFTYYNTQKGLSSNFIMSIREDAEGNIWVGTNDAGLSIIRKNGLVDNYDTRRGLANNVVFNTYTDNQGVTWITTGGGISRFENGKFFNYTLKEGLINDSPFDFIEDNFGNIWMSSSKGIIYAKKQELNDFAQGKIKKINWVDYDKHDGMKSEDCTGAAHSLKTSDGKIWIPTNGGAVIIDPQNMPRNHLKPLIRINSLLADRQLVDIHKLIQISPDKRRFVFDYSALSLLASAKVKFKYKLVGFDRDWQDVGSKREATYTNLAPGTYTFWVIACNNDGVWNEEGVKLSFVKKPYFHETWGFYLLLAFVLAVLVASTFRWRVYAIQQRKRELETLVEIKTREVWEQNRILAKQRDEISHQKRLVEKRNDNITNSINYAKRIQEAILPPMDEIKAFLPEFFIYFEPKDIVSGDFYWISTPHHREGKMVVAAVDCTGHGVPGAFMSMIGNDLLNEIVNLREIVEPDRILQELHFSINKTLKQQDTFNRDGMDLVLCVIDKNQKTVEFAGAKNALYYIQKGELHEIKGDKMPIGGYYKELEPSRKFTKHIIPIDQPTHFYMLSDGFQDQYGEHSHKKFSRQQIRKVLLEIHQNSLDEQKQILADTIRNWMGNEDQIDDILVFGFKLE